MSKNFADNDNMTALMTAVGNKLSEKSKIFYGSETDWNNLTVAQKKEYDYWASPEIIPNMSSKIMPKLWENPSPTSAFAAQSVTLTSDDYDFLLFIFLVMAGGRAVSVMVPKGQIGAMTSSYTDTAAYTTVVSRIFNFTGDTVVDFGEGAEQHATSARTTNNSRCVPLCIYGIKTDVNSVCAKAGFTPIGTIISVMGNSAPVNYLPCNGQAVNIVDYPELADYFEQQFGSKNKFGGDGVTTFCLPDLRGEFLRGTGTNVHTNQGSGANVGSHQDGTTIPWSGTSSNATGINFRKKDTTSANLPSNMDSQIGLTKGMSGVTATYNATGSSSDLGERYTVRPTNTSVLYCIATKNIYLDPSQDYSTSEKMIGHWIDGKPLYQKTFLIKAPKVTTPGTMVAKSTPHNIANIGSRVKCILHGSGSAQIFGNSNNISYLTVYADGTNLNVRTNNTIWSDADIIATLQYTKTTD